MPPLHAPISLTFAFLFFFLPLILNQNFNSNQFFNSSHLLNKQTNYLPTFFFSSSFQINYSIAHTLPFFSFFTNISLTLPLKPITGTWLPAMSTIKTALDIIQIVLYSIRHAPQNYCDYDAPMIDSFPKWNYCEKTDFYKYLFNFNSATETKKLDGHCCQGESWLKEQQDACYPLSIVLFLKINSYNKSIHLQALSHWARLILPECLGREWKTYTRCYGEMRVQMNCWMGHLLLDWVQCHLKERRSHLLETLQGSSLPPFPSPSRALLPGAEQ